MIVPLDKIAMVSLGYKSLQNNFYYLNNATVDTYGVESRFLKPIRRLADLSPKTYLQEPKAEVWLFDCRLSEADLRGTGALRYIDAMAERPAAERKQAAKTTTIREALSAQGGNIWYAPKASPNRHGLWIRKAFNGVFAPFIFKIPTLIDQRCNSISPLGGLTQAEIAAVLSSSLFAYSLEVNGSSTLGAGALEAATKAVRLFPVVDPSSLSDDGRANLVKMARECWKDKPHDWAQPRATIPSRLRDLDSWLLAQVGSDTTVDRLHRDLTELVAERLHIARDKVRAVKKKRTDSIGTVAQPIADRIRKQLTLKSIPESFLPHEKLDIRIDLGGTWVRQIKLKRLLGEFEIALDGEDDVSLFNSVVNSATAELICRSVLANRGSFQVTTDRTEATLASERMMKWLEEIDREVDIAVASSSLGTGYEDILKREVMSRVGVNGALFVSQLPDVITLDKKI